MHNTDALLLKQNAICLEQDLTWLSSVIKKRMDCFFNLSENNGFDIDLPPDFSGNDSVYAQFINHYNLNVLERLALILALTPHVCAQMLDVFLIRNDEINRGYTEFGGILGEHHAGFLPTGETLAFLAGGTNIEVKFSVLKMFDAAHVFALHNILELKAVRNHEPKLCGALVISADLTELFTIGKAAKPNFSEQFPARLIHTSLQWTDFIADETLMNDINTILLWIKHKETILNKWQLNKTIKPGYKALFYGPPGTGKTFAACLIGKESGKDVYKIDLSMIVSKWVGETEKNLARVFDMAENKDWILFFDEADALFGKRTGTGNSQERYANQEVAYLLQRTEEYPGTIILASNLKGNMDEAFTRRFQSVIYFPQPKPKQRLRLWENYLKSTFDLSQTMDLQKIANDYEITGGGIVNILKYCAIHAANRNSKTLCADDLIDGIRRELLKEGKLL